MATATKGAGEMLVLRAASAWYVGTEASLCEAITVSDETSIEYRLVAQKVKDVLDRARPSSALGSAFRYTSCSPLEQDVLASYTSLEWGDAQHKYAWLAWMRFIAPARLGGGVLLAATMWYALCGVW